MSAILRKVPPREWLAVFFPPIVGAILLFGAGAEAARDENAWVVFGVVAAVGFAVPLAYTLSLAMKGRLFLRNETAIVENQGRTARSMRWGWAIVPVLLAVGVVADAVSTVCYVGLGAAAFGFWPGMLANFVRLYREQWSKA